MNSTSDPRISHSPQSYTPTPSSESPPKSYSTDFPRGYAKQLAFTVLFAGTLSSPLFADITGDTSAVEITGTETSGYDGSGNDGQTITVKAGATVENTDDGIILGSNGTLTIEQAVGDGEPGQIHVTPTLSAAGVLVYGDNNTVNNHGVIFGDGTNLLDPEIILGIDILGTDASVTNTGKIQLSLDGTDNRGAIGISSVIGLSTVDNSGTILVENAGGELAEGISVVSSTTVTNSGSITVTGGPGQSTSIPDFFDPFGPPIEIPANPITRGIHVFGTEDGDERTLITNTGQITVTGNNTQPYTVVGVAIDNAGDFLNSGTITATNSDEFGSAVGLMVQVDTATASLTNTGTITADDAILIDPAFMSITTPDVSLTNSGKLEGHINLGDGNHTIDNQATGVIGRVDSENDVSLSSNLIAGTGDTTLTNRGRITGNIDLGNGNNTVTVNFGGQIDGTLSTGDGNDVLTNFGTIVGNVQLGAGDDIVNFESTGIFSGLVDAGSGGETLGDTLNLFGTHHFDGAKFLNFETVNGGCSDILGTEVEIGAIVTIDDDCGLTNAAQLTVKSISAGSGNNTITLNESGSITIDPITGKIDLGVGYDNLIANISGSSFIKGDLVGIESFVKNGEGTFTYTGEASFESTTINEGTVSLEDATLTDSNLTFGGAGNLTIDADSTLTQTEGDAITGSNFDDVVINEGAIEGGIDLGLGNDLLQNSGTITGNIDLGVGNDRMIMDHSQENDSKTSYGSAPENDSFVQSAIDGGDGLDTLELRGTGSLGNILSSTAPSPVGFEAMEVKGQWSTATDLNLTSGTKLIGDGSSLNIVLTDFHSDITGDDASNTLHVTVGSLIGDVDLGAGDDNITLYGGGTISGTVSGNEGLDTLQLRGKSSGDIFVYDGTFSGFEKLELLSTDDEAAVWSLAGTQSYSEGVFLTGEETQLVNTGSLTATFTGDDNTNAIFNQEDASISGDISFGGGTDILLNSGTITGDIDMGAGVDYIHNPTGTIDGNISMGAGNDSLNSENLGTVTGTIDMGADDDEFRLTGNSIGLVSKLRGGEQTEGGFDKITLSGDINALFVMDQLQGFEKAVIEESIWTLLGAQTFEAGVELVASGQMANWGQLAANVTGDHNTNLLTNAVSGTLTGDVDLKDGNDGVWNLGTLEGDLALGANDDWLINVGTIKGDVLFGEGSDSLDITNGTIEGKVDFGDGDDSITAANGGTVEGGVFFGDGDDTFTNDGNATFDVDFGDGADTLKNADSTITGNVDFGAGNDSVNTADLGTITGKLTLGDGDDTLTNTGTYEKDIYFGDGADSLENATGTIVGNLYFEGGNDVLDLMKIGQIQGTIDLGSGDDSLVVTVEGANFDGSIFSLFDIIGGEGEDTIELTGNGTFSGSLDSDLESLGLSIGEWTLTGTQTYERIRIIGTGSLVNESTITAAVTGDENQNKLSNKESITGNIDLLEGDDILKNSGTITGSVNLGTGSDQLDNASGKIVGDVDFGAGDEVVTNGNLGVITGSVTLGQGNDTFIWDGSAPAGTSPISGGDDSDTLRLTDSGTLAADTFADFEALDVRGPSWTLTGTQTYSSGVLLGADAHLTNTGSLTADITGDGHPNSLTNTDGTLTGDLNFGDGPDTLDNTSGSITGSVNFGGGSDNLDNTGGTISGDIDFGAGDDTFAASRLGSVSGTISLGAGNDRLQISSGSYALGQSVGASISIEDGIDTLELQGTGTLNQGDFEGYETLDVNGTGGDASWTLTGEQIYSGGVYLTATSSVLIENSLISNFVGDDSTNKVENQGTVYTNALGLDLGEGADSLVNSGNMSGFFLVAPLTLGDGNDSLVNSGTLNGAIDLGNGEDQVANSGTILGTLFLGHQDDILVNTNAITADVDLGSGADAFTNTGTLTGKLNLGHDNDLLNNSGQITGSIYSAASMRIVNSPIMVGENEMDYYNEGVPDDDGFTNSGTVKGTTYLGGGADWVTNESNGTFEGDLSLGDSAISQQIGTGAIFNLFKASDRDVLTNRGHITGNVSLGSERNSITTDTGKLFKDGDDSDTLTNSGSIVGNVSLGNGSQNVSVGSGGHAFFGADNDLLSNSGTISGNVFLGNGKNNLSGSSGGKIVFGEDNDQLTNDGTITGNIYLGNGESYGEFSSGSTVVFSNDNDTLTNNGTINGDIFLSNEGSSWIADSGASVFGGTDNDTLVNSGTINGKVHFGNGDDTLVWGVGGVFSNIADGGTGTDTVKTENPAGTNVAIDFGKLVNFEKLVTNGAGTVSLSGKGNIGAVAVNKGSLAVNTVLYADVQVTEGAKLQGNGFLFGKVTNVSGSVAPGNSIGHLTIEGDYTQSSGGAFELEIFGSDNDRLTVTGSAQIGGTLNLVTDFDKNDVKINDSFTFITAANGLTGAFDTVNGATPYFMEFTPVYSENAVAARLVRNSFVLPNMSAQQTAIASSLDRLGEMSDQGNASEAARIFLEDLTWTERVHALPSFDQLANTSIARLNVPTVRSRQAFMTSVFDQAMQHTHSSEGWYSTNSLYDEKATLDPVGNLSGYTYSSDGAMTTYSFLNDDTAVGLVLGASRMKLATPSSWGKNGRTSLDTAIFYSRRTESGFDIGATLGLAVDKYKTAREIVSDRQTLDATSNIDGRSVMAGLRAQKAFSFGDFTATGVADLQYTSVNRGAATETGANELDLNLRSSSFDSLKSALGMRLAQTDVSSTKRFIPSLGLYWEHEFDASAGHNTASFSATPDISFESEELPLPEDQLRAELSLVARLSEKLLLELSHSGTFASEIDADKTMLTFRYGW